MGAELEGHGDLALPAVRMLGLLVLLGITGAAGRGRVHSVRRKLLQRAGMERKRS